MENSPDGIGGGLTSPDDRFNGQLGYRPGGRRELGGLEPPDREPPRNGNSGFGSVLDRPAPKTGTAVYERTVLGEPALGETWPQPPAPSPAADHPLVRGLMLELPPRGSAMPSREWLDRWFEATRSILELIYTQDGEENRARR